MAAPPDHDAAATRWYDQGRLDESAARVQELTRSQVEVTATLDSLARLRNQRGAPDNAEELVTALARVYCPDRLRMRFRGAHSA